MTMIKYDHPQTLEALVARIAETKLKVAQVRRRLANGFQLPNVPVPAGVATSHIHMLNTLMENLELDIDIGVLLEPVTGSPGRFASTDSNQEKKYAEIEGTFTFRALFETMIFLGELVDRINELLDQADKDVEDDFRRYQRALTDAEDMRMEACRRK